MNAYFLVMNSSRFKSTSGALAEGTRNSSPKELDDDNALTEPELDDIDSLLSILNY